MKDIIEFFQKDENYTSLEINLDKEFIDFNFKRIYVDDESGDYLFELSLSILFGVDEEFNLELLLERLQEKEGKIGFREITEQKKKKYVLK